MTSSFKPSMSLLMLLAFAMVVRSQEDGFTFDTPEDMDDGLIPPQRPQYHLANVQTAIVGKVFHFAVQQKTPRHGFKAKQQPDSTALPSWLVFNKNTGSFSGVPLPGEEGTFYISVSSVGEEAPPEHFELRVLEAPAEELRSCEPVEDNTVLTLLLDQSLQAIKPKQRVVLVSNIASFLSLPQSAFTLKPQLVADDITDSAVVLAGPGNVQARKKSTSSLQVLVGCDGRLWESTAPLIHNLKQQARDGTIAEVLGLPLIGWRVKTETGPALRSKRQAIDDFGSGDYDSEYYDDYEDYNDEDDLGDVETNPPTSNNKQVTLPTSSSTTSTTTAASTATHPHRHHHGEVKPSEEDQPDQFLPIEEALPEQSRTVTGPSVSTQPPSDPGPTRIDIPKPSEALDFDADYDYDQNYDDEDDTEDEGIESETIVPDTNVPTTQRSEEGPEEPDVETSVIKSSTTAYSSTTEAATTFEIVVDTEPPVYSVAAANETTTPSGFATETLPPPSSSNAPMTSSTTTEAATTEAVTAPEIPATTTESPTTEEEASRTTTPRQVPTTEEVVQVETVKPVHRIVPEPRNTKPYIENRLQYKSVTAGKVFRFEIPKNTFRDAEDGYNLTLQVLDGNEQPIARTSWLQFNPARRELYGLPLPEDVSNWVYVIRASDKDGAFEQDQLTVQVQQHRLERVVNHEFSVHLRIEKAQEYPHYVDWSLKVLRALGRIYSTNMSEITVRHINHTNVPVVFAWANDSLPTNYCPRQEIQELYKMLTANDRGDPSMELSSMLAPGLRVKKVLSQDLAICEQQPAAPVTPTTNFSPILRNPIDTVNATLGELLVYKVKDDTFYDPEDVDPLTLNITLLTFDLEPIPANSWLQFDSKNREFYGIPHKAGITEYFLVCIDSGGMEAKDSLVVHVHPAPKRPYNVEFSMTIGVPLETFSSNAALQRKFVEKLMEIFKESTSGNFHFRPFTAKRDSNFDSTVVYWFNKSLPVDACPNREIKQLEHVLHSESRSISSTVHRIMAPDFTVSTIKVHHIGNCKAKPAPLPTPDVQAPSEKTPQPQADNDVMLTLILPIIIISIMLFVAFVAACLLYRKRRMGKMNVEEDGRQSYGNKGIPVIFQEELEEKPEPGTKAPVILKDEKPPLAPPEYSKSGSLKMEDSEPYQPPPPFTRTQDNGRQPRPKPTPTYRKPPPYVPP